VFGLVSITSKHGRTEKQERKRHAARKENPEQQEAIVLVSTIQERRETGRNQIDKEEGTKKIKCSI